VELLDRPLRAAILAAADNAFVQRVVSRYGFSLGAKRFVAGETAGDFLAVAKALNAQGFAVACGILGEGVRNAEEAQSATDQYCALLHAFAEQRIDANVAFKLTHVGLDLSPDLALANAARIAQAASETGNTMRLDMEQSRYVDPTLAIYRALRTQFACVGFVLQAYLFRSLSDLQSAMALQPNVRIVKGAYLEPPSVAFAAKAEVDANYMRLLETALSCDGYTAIATHDRRIIERAIELVEGLGLPKRGRFVFQMLYGISGAVAQELARAGYRVRLAVPFGGYWFPYLMRRLAERPANLAFFLKGALARR
jgi:proline dehydrogenase